MPTQTQLPIPRITPGDFKLIPDTNTYVSVSKLMDSKGNVISNINGYRKVQIAQALGFYLISSEEWGKSRRYFQRNPDRKFRGRTGKEIERNYITKHTVQTGSFLSFKWEGGFPANTYDLLKEAGFDGKTALIDFPYVQEDGNNFIFIKSPRMRIRDVTEINGRPFPRKFGFVQGYDWDTGLITEVGPNPNPDPDFHGAHYLVVPNKTRMVLRGRWSLPRREAGRFYVTAYWEPSALVGGVSTRLSSKNKPSEILRLSP